MNKVASHINEMQKIHEEFGAVFDQLITEQSGEKKEVCRSNMPWFHIADKSLNRIDNECCSFQVADLSMGDLLLHTSVTWLNPPASLGKWKKEPQLATFGMYGIYEFPP